MVGVGHASARSGCLVLLAGCGAVLCAAAEIDVSFLYTQTPQYDARAASTGGERFPAGASLQLVVAGRTRALAPGFAASADGAVSFDGKSVLFAGKRAARDPWQIWEVPAAGGAPRRIIAAPNDTIRPHYLPGERVVYAVRTPRGYQLETARMDGGAPLRLTYGPGNHLTCGVLRDGRVLFEAPHPAGREIYTVYSDGTGVEAHRCDHGGERGDAREMASGDIVFASGGRLWRFTSARAEASQIAAGDGEFAGGAAEAAGVWLAAWRAGPGGFFAVRAFEPGGGADRIAAGPKGAHALDPVVLEPHAVPKRHPSALGDRDGANILCLNAYTSRNLKIPEGSVAAVRVWSEDAALGTAPVERDGSFFVQVPTERAIRFELLDRSGKTVAAEKGWFWARRGEQRVCVGCHAGPERAPDNVAPAVLLRTTEPVRMGGAR